MSETNGHVDPLEQTGDSLDAPELPEVRFARLVGHMLDRDRKSMDDRLGGIEATLRTIAGGLLELKADRVADAEWKRKTDDRLAELEAWRKRKEAAE